MTGRRTEDDGEIEITEEMIEAGASVLGNVAPDEYEWIVFNSAGDSTEFHALLKRIYSSMARKRPS